MNCERTDFKEHMLPAGHLLFNFITSCNNNTNMAVVCICEVDATLARMLLTFCEMTDPARFKTTASLSRVNSTTRPAFNNVYNSYPC
jgi:hypothetical protein